MKITSLCVASLVAAASLQVSAQPVVWDPPHPKPATEEEVVENYKAFLFPAEEELEELRVLFRDAIGNPDEITRLHHRIRLLQHAIKLAGGLNNDRYYPYRPANALLNQFRQTDSYKTSSLAYRLKLQVWSLSERVNVFTWGKYQGSEGWLARQINKLQLRNRFDRDYQSCMHVTADSLSLQSGYLLASLRYGIKPSGELREDWQPEYLQPLYTEERPLSWPFEGKISHHLVYWEEIQRRIDQERIRRMQEQGADEGRNRSASGSAASDDSDISR
ncbi:hypothetical protein JW872_00590 [Candidatus Babeliales bacterium]|nr:hypothetical protein [Candidatus Babeliales bacterium]